MTLPIGTRVRVYRNLHKQCLSVQVKTPRGWRVADHVNLIRLEDVRFLVNPKGRARVLAERRKNVHAVVEGTISWHAPIFGRQVRYNPYERDCFYDVETKESIIAAWRAVVTPDGIAVSLT